MRPLADDTPRDIEQRRELAARAYPEIDRLGLRPSTEDTLLHLLRCLGDGNSTPERQWRDILGIIRTQGERLDRDYLKSNAPAGAFAAAGGEGFMASMAGTGSFGNGSGGIMAGSAYGIGLGVSGMLTCTTLVKTGDLSMAPQAVIDALRQNFGRLSKSLQDRLRALCR